MNLEAIGVLVAVLVAVASGAFAIGRSAGLRDDIMRARDRIDEMEKEQKEILGKFIEFMAYWKRQ